MSEKSTRYNGVYIDPLGYLYVDGVKVARVQVVNGIRKLQFYDKDRRRSSCRRSCFVSVDVNQLMKVINDDTTM